MERAVAANSGMVPKALEAGTVTTSPRRPRSSSRRRTAREQVPAAQVRRPQRADVPQPETDREAPAIRWTEGQILADGAATEQRRARARQEHPRRLHAVRWLQLRGRDPHLGGAARQDTYTSIHIEEFEIEIRETKLGREEFTNDIPNVSERALRNLDEEGIVRIGTHVMPGDILVGKVSPKSKSELSARKRSCSTRSSVAPART